MKILALDFSTSQRCAGVVQPAVANLPVFQSEMVEAGGRSTRAFGLVEQALAEARLEREAIECVAVGLGPGSYTGIRAAIAIAQGWQLARGVSVVGISTVEVLAAQLQAECVSGCFHIVVDAQRGEFYHSTWKVCPSSRVETSALTILTRAELEARVAGGTPVFGPDLKRTLPRIREIFPSARILGRLALGHTGFVRGETLSPVYLRETRFVKAPPPRKL